MQYPYPKTLKTLGDHLRKRRLEIGLLQKDVASQIGVTTCTVQHWELNETEPDLPHVPKVIEFIGFDPAPPAQMLGERLAATRRRQGLSLKALARQLGVDPGSLGRWERGGEVPLKHHRHRLESFLKEYENNREALVSLVPPSKAGTKT